MIAEPMTLFDAPIEGPLPVRSSDPETSRAAAIDLLGRIKERKREVYLALEALGVASPASAIKREMANQGVIREMGTIRSRLAQMEHDGLTRTTGGVQVGESGRAEQLWGLTAWSDS